ncbi:hypothetical protein BKA64DRAFT_170105 [Cadophora sp. MPI-SDFR-AT-0126]|nr:hypothetical protein BKA64DRAFT_170105 [Leotiomycetes sp. MPI-SDFR-AT-0126]
MDSKTIVDVRSCVFAIVQEYSEALNLFVKWRSGRSGKRAVGQEECKTSLEEGQSTIEDKFQRCSQKHGVRFDRGDRMCLDELIEIRARFKQDVLERLSRSVAGKLSKVEKIGPLVLIKAIESTRKETILAMDELSRRIGNGTAGPYTMTDPGDVLPHMPLRPTPAPQPLGTNPNSGQTSIPTSLQDVRDGTSGPIPFRPQVPQTSYVQPLPGSVNSSQVSVDTPFVSIPQRISAPMASSWTLPDFGTSQALVRARPSSPTTALSWMKDMFPVKSTRPYYDITPLKPTPAVVPTFTCEIDATDILEEGERAAQKLWDAAVCEENHRLRAHAQSAPIPQGPWKSMFGEDEDDDEDEVGDRRTKASQPPKKKTTSTLPDEEDTQRFLRPILSGARPSSVHGESRVRSQPKLEFSVVTPRFRRHVSNPETRSK